MSNCNFGFGTRVISVAGRQSLFMDMALICGKIHKFNQFLLDSKKKIRLNDVRFYFSLAPDIVYCKDTSANQQRIFNKAEMLCHYIDEGELREQKLIIRAEDHEHFNGKNITCLNMVVNLLIDMMSRDRAEISELEILLEQFKKFVDKSFKDVSTSFGYPVDESRTTATFSLFLNKEINTIDEAYRGLFQRVKQDLEEHLPDQEFLNSKIVKTFMEDPQVCYYYMVTMLIKFNTGDGKAKTYNYVPFLKRAFELE